MKRCFPGQMSAAEIKKGEADEKRQYRALHCSREIQKQPAFDPKREFNGRANPSPSDGFSFSSQHNITILSENRKADHNINIHPDAYYFSHSTTA